MSLLLMFRRNMLGLDMALTEWKLMNLLMIPVGDSVLLPSYQDARLGAQLNPRLLFPGPPPLYVVRGL